MTTEEIVKALLDECKDCSARGHTDEQCHALYYCANREAADIITRQQAEIAEKDARIAELEAEVAKLKQPESLLNPAGKYAAKFAENHGMSIHDAMQQPMVKARFHLFNETGM